MLKRFTRKSLNDARFKRYLLHDRHALHVLHARNDTRNTLHDRNGKRKTYNKRTANAHETDFARTRNARCTQILQSYTQFPLYHMDLFCQRIIYLEPTFVDGICCSLLGHLNVLETPKHKLYICNRVLQLPNGVYF